MNLSNRRGLIIILTVLYAGGIFYLSSMPGSSLNVGGSSVERTLSNLAHIPLYWLLAFLLSFTIRSPWKILLLAMIIASLDEFNQSFVPGRSSTVLDLMLDGIGIGAALWQRGPETVGE